MPRVHPALVALVAVLWGPGPARAQDAEASPPEGAPPAVDVAPPLEGGASSVAPAASGTAHAALSDEPNGDAAATVPPDDATPAVPPRSAPAPAERVAVLLVPTGAVDPTTTDSLTELLISAVAARGVTQIVGKEELQALLGRDDAGILACVQSGVCLGQISVELGVREVVAGTLGERAGGWVFALARIDARTGETAGRVFREVDGDLAALVGSLAGSVPELYVEAVRPGRLVIEVLDARTGARVEGAEIVLDGEPLGRVSASAFRRELVAPGPHALEVRSPRYGTLARDIDVEEGSTLFLDATLVRVERGTELSALTWTSALLGVGLLGAAIGLGVVSQEPPSPTLTMRATFDFFDAREREAIAADVLYGVGGAALALATVSLVLDLTGAARGSDEELHVGLGTSGLTLRGAFP